MTTPDNLSAAEKEQFEVVCHDVHVAPSTFRVTAENSVLGPDSQAATRVITVAWVNKDRTEKYDGSDNANWLAEFRADLLRPNIIG
ncbi:MAG: hypothetical protein V4632_06405 [Pseudomonadota bacterium]